ncbi:hypothetical protein [Legionella sainthelensi]|uniref:hypothetical protein n=1 Tax=Legionella sainthelensi TaxID=28087 RepID=UPI000E201522|nr:hypothetical protein [Legionella sainthelensi]
MEGSQELLIKHYRIIKKNLGVTLGGLVFASVSYANTHCPDLNIEAFCHNGTWEIAITPNDPYWELMGDSVNGSQCTRNEQAKDVRWNYAFSSARMGIVGCNYKLFSNMFNQIGLIQIKSTQYIRTGNNWEKESYPGNWTCHESQETCLFR